MIVKSSYSLFFLLPPLLYLFCLLYFFCLFVLLSFHSLPLFLDKSYRYIHMRAPQHIQPHSNFTFPVHSDKLSFESGKPLCSLFLKARLYIGHQPLAGCCIGFCFYVIRILHCFLRSVGLKSMPGSSALLPQHTSKQTKNKPGNKDSIACRSSPGLWGEYLISNRKYRHNRTRSHSHISCRTRSTCRTCRSRNSSRTSSFSCLGR